MVSIHKVPVIVHLIIRVISSTFRFKREDNKEIFTLFSSFAGKLTSKHRTSIAQEHRQTQIIRFILSRKGDILHSESTNDKTPEGPEIVFIYPIASESK